MKQMFFSLIFLLTLLSAKIYSQNNPNVKISEKTKIDSVAKLFLSDVSKSPYGGISANIIDTASLTKSKNFLISMTKKFEKKGSPGMMMLPSDSLKLMTPLQVWNYENKISSYMQKTDMHIKWHITGTEITNDTAYVRYNAIGRPPKVMKLKRYGNNWKIILSFKSIF